MLAKILHEWGKLTEGQTESFVRRHLKSNLHRCVNDIESEAQQELLSRLNR